MKNGLYELVIAPKDYPGKKYRNRYAYEHHVVWWENYSKLPPEGFEIHHLNGNHRDNRLTNLILLTKLEHQKVHGDKLKSEHRVNVKCAYCFSLVNLRGNDFRSKKKKQGFKGFFCNKSCAAKKQFSKERARKAFFEDCEIPLRYRDEVRQDLYTIFNAGWEAALSSEVKIIEKEFK